MATASHRAFVPKADTIACWQVFWLIPIHRAFPFHWWNSGYCGGVEDLQLREQLPGWTGFPFHSRRIGKPSRGAKCSRLSWPGMTTPAYDLRPLDLSAEGLAQVNTLLRLVFPHATHYSEALLRWQYVDNPDGLAVGYNAWAGEELAAHYVTIPMRALVHGREERGLLSLNTATAPTHQGKGLFTRLAEATYRAGAEQGFGFVVGVANANSTHGFTKKLGFQLVSPLRAMVGIGSLPLRPDGGNVQFAPMHSEAKLRWRTAHPAHVYTLAAQPHMWTVLSPKRMKGARFVLATGLGGAPRLVLRKEKAPALKAWIGLDPSMAWTSSAYLNVPMRLRPSPLNMIFKDLSGAARKLDASKVRMEAIDFDVL